MTRRRMSFRTRLGIIITVVFVLAGAGLLAAQYFTVVQLFASAIQVTTSSCVSADGRTTTVTGSVGATTGCDIPPGDGTLSPGPSDEGTVVGGSVSEDETTGAVIRQSLFLSDQVIGGLLVWSGVLLVVFTAVAAVAAFWLARRSLDRIGEVTAAARQISERDLARRLDLPGPEDEIKELGDTFDGMLDRLHLAFTAQDRFVANASHELRTPLTTTRTALEIPLRQGAVPPDLEPAVRRALRATAQSERLIESLLALARGRRDPTDTRVLDLGPVVEEELADLDTGDVAVRCTVAAAEVSGDPVLLARSVRNLLDNGIRHNTPGGSLTVDLRREGDAAVLTVENTGAELDAGAVRLFTEPFHRGAGRRASGGRADGVGLGLAIVESIAMTHGGSLRLSARPGGGLVARLELPLAASTAGILPGA